MAVDATPAIYDRGTPVIDLTPIEKEVIQLPAEEAIAHPDCPAEFWWGLAARHPMAAMASVLYPLLTLESPERWEKLVFDNLGVWVMEACAELSETNQHLFCADVGEHVLPIFEADYPGDPRPRNAIRVHRQYARGEATIEQWREAQQGAYEFTMGVDVHAAWSAALACGGEPVEPGEMEEPFGFLRLAAEAAEASAMEREESGAVAYAQETAWQWRRLLQYLQGEVAA